MIQYVAADCAFLQEVEAIDLIALFKHDWLKGSILQLKKFRKFVDLRK